jgi:hypothetical protein
VQQTQSTTSAKNAEGIRPIQPTIPLVRTFLSKSASIRETAKKLCHQAQLHHAYYADEKTGEIMWYAIDLSSPIFQPFHKRTLHTFESLELWLRMRFLFEYERNQTGLNSDWKQVIAQGVTIGIGGPTNTRVVVSGKIVVSGRTTVTIDAVSMTRGGINLLEGGKPQDVTIKLHKISRISLYKPWSS